MSLRDKILAAEDRKTVPLEIPEWDCTVGITTMSGSERDAFEAACLGDDGKMSMANIRAKLAAFTVVDDTGKRVFGDGDAELLGEKSAAPLARIFDVSSKLNRLSKDDVAELAKNSDTGLGAGSPSGSPSH